MSHYVALTILVTSFLAGSMGYARSPIDRNDNFMHESNTIPKMVSTLGYLTCVDEQYSKDEACGLMFIRESDMRKFEVMNNPQLLAAHKKDHQNLKIALTGDVVMRSTLHEDHLKVKSFSVLGVVENLGSIKANNQQFNNRSDGGIGSPGSRRK